MPADPTQTVPPDLAPVDEPSLLGNPMVLGVTGLVLAVGGFASYFALLADATVRATAWPTFTMLTLGAALGIAAVRRRRRWWTVALGTADVGVAVLFVYLFFIEFSLPVAAAAAPATADAAPTFSLPDEQGNPVALADFRGRGPVLLVFYRGHW